jgi:hypothetical protein
MPAISCFSWLDTLKRVAPDNALADYLSANDYDQ